MPFCFHLTGQEISTPNSRIKNNLGAVGICTGAASLGGDGEVWEPIAFPSQPSHGERGW